MKINPIEIPLKKTGLLKFGIRRKTTKARFRLATVETSKRKDKRIN